MVRDGLPDCFTAGDMSHIAVYCVVRDTFGRDVNELV